MGIEDVIGPGRLALITGAALGMGLCPVGPRTAMDARRIAWGAGVITGNRPPLSRWHPDWAERAAQARS